MINEKLEKLNQEIAKGEARYTSPALAAPATPLWTCRPGTPCAASCSRPASLQFIYSKTGLPVV